MANSTSSLDLIAAFNAHHRNLSATARALGLGRYKLRAALIEANALTSEEIAVRRKEGRVTKRPQITTSVDISSQPPTLDKDAQLRELITENPLSLFDVCEKLDAGPSTVRQWLSALNGSVQTDGERYWIEKPKPVVIEVPVTPADRINERKALKQLKEEREYLEAKAAELERTVATYETFTKQHIVIPDWQLRPYDAQKHVSTAMTILSDTHFDEVVYPAQVQYINEYNRAIAEKRLENYFQNLIEFASNYLTNLEWDGIVLNFGGDMVSGDIHHELTETNDAPILDTVLHWAGRITAGIRLLKEHFGRVAVYGVVGNHGRRSRKPRAKFRVKDNFDWMMYQIIAGRFDGDSNVTFCIPESADCSYAVHGKQYMLTHGDQFSGGNGIAGILSPIMRGDAKKRSRAQAVNAAYDYLMMGHWHSTQWHDGIIVNNCLKGFDEYAYVSNFKPSAPEQVFWVNDAKHGKTIKAEIRVQDDSEKYRLR